MLVLWGPTPSPHMPHHAPTPKIPQTAQIICLKSLWCCSMSFFNRMLALSPRVRETDDTPPTKTSDPIDDAIRSSSKRSERSAPVSPVVEACFKKCRTETNY